MRNEIASLNINSKVRTEDYYKKKLNKDDTFQSTLNLFNECLAINKFINFIGSAKAVKIKTVGKDIAGIDAYIVNEETGEILCYVETKTRNRTAEAIMSFGGIRLNNRKLLKLQQCKNNTGLPSFFIAQFSCGKAYAIEVSEIKKEWHSGKPMIAPRSQKMLYNDLGPDIPVHCMTRIY